jgi:CubicO group peptidase (beta-lactamase class C family)
MALAANKERSMRKLSWIWPLLALVLFFSCNRNDDPGPALMTPDKPDTKCTDQELAQLEESMTSALTGTSTDAFFTLMLASADGRMYSFSTGASTSTSSYESASTSKLVTAVVILSLIDQGTSRPGRRT